jgi:hypothetical protein
VLQRFALVVLLLTAFGCSKEVSKPEATNQPPELSSTVDRPEETKLDTKTSLADLEKNHELKAYTGAIEDSAEVFKRGDGGTKYVVIFSTKDDSKKVTEFYKKELGDGKTDSKGVGTSMGMTKANGSVIVIAEPAENGAKVKVTLISYTKS